jgi:uncharacterized membrane protein YdbT with pleckstrin-like domain
MTDLVIRPTAKFIKGGAAAAVLLVIILELLMWPSRDTLPVWVLALPIVFLLWPVSRWVRRQCTKAVISGDRLRAETGVLSRSTRNIQLSKIQDVRVDQKLADRMMNVGDLSIETAGETSRLTLPNVDSPQALADEIMTRVQRGTAA